MRVLLVEDSQILRDSLTTGLRQAGYAVDAAADGNAGLWSAQSNDYDVIVLDTAARMVYRGSEAIDLAPREYALLEYMALRQGQVVTRAEIEEHIYDDQVDPMSNVIDAAVYTLRKRIDAPGKSSIIQTRRGMGYTLNAQPPQMAQPQVAGKA
jgi:DNA-binding response OmpR family regulator